MDNLVFVSPYGPKSGEKNLKVKHVVQIHFLVLMQYLPKPLLDRQAIKIRDMNSQRRSMPCSFGKGVEEKKVK